jgi:sporadic carbohydrate cluster protein (TIGR04323 family)
MNPTSKIERYGLLGYVTSREFGGLRIPVPLQSLALRDYCSRRSFVYKLHSNENIFPNSYLVLDGLINAVPSSKGIVMCSIFMLPESKSLRMKFLERIFNHSGEVHFVLEDIVLQDIYDVKHVDLILNCVAIQKKCLKPIAFKDLLVTRKL